MVAICSLATRQRAKREPSFPENYASSRELPVRRRGTGAKKFVLHKLFFFSTYLLHSSLHHISLISPIKDGKMNLQQQQQHVSSKLRKNFLRKKVKFLTPRSTQSTLYESYISDEKASETASETSDASLEELLADAHIYIMSFLDIDSLRQMMCSNRRFRSLLSSDTAHTLWLIHCQSTWGSTASASSSTMCLQDNLHLPTAASLTSSFARFNKINLPLLLCKTSGALPTKVDESLLPRGEFQLENAAASADSSMIQAHNNKDNETVKMCCIRYTREVGSAQVHSIRSDHPLPRPTRRSSGGNSKKTFRLRIHNKPTWNPFVAPFRTVADRRRCINVTPRLVSYFEITILKASPEQEGRRQFSFDFLEEPRVQDCVAIGLATEIFDCQSALPGWNSVSFGYHSDNGGLYHGSGRMQKRAGTFGTGDTVGMGIDYVTRGIFVTKNSKFLGFGWDDLPFDYLEETRLYPMVGIDSKEAVVLNYCGVDRPFQFDLAAYCCRQQQSRKHSKSGIAKRYQFSTSCQ
jgi:hypothetical protein